MPDIAFQELETAIAKPSHSLFPSPRTTAFLARYASRGRRAWRAAAASEGTRVRRPEPGEPGAWSPAKIHTLLGARPWGLVLPDSIFSGFGQGGRGPLDGHFREWRAFARAALRAPTFFVNSLFTDRPAFSPVLRPLPAVW